MGLERAFEEHLHKGSSISNMGSVAIPWDYGGVIWRPSLPPISAQFSGGHVFKPRQKFFNNKINGMHEWTIAMLKLTFL